MTSMLLIDRIGSILGFSTAAIVSATSFLHPQKVKRRALARRCRWLCFSLYGLLFLGAVAGSDAFLLRVLGGRGLDHRTHDRLVGLDPVANHVPALAVPLHELHPTAALMIHARHL